MTRAIAIEGGSAGGGPEGRRRKTDSRRLHHTRLVRTGHIVYTHSNLLNDSQLGARRDLLNLREALVIFRGVGSLLAALTIAYFTYMLTLSSQKEMSDYHRRQLAYTRLLGLRFPIRQLYVSRFEAKIYSDYYEARWILAGKPNGAFDFQEANRWMHKSEDMVFNIIDLQKELYACVGEIQILFEETGRLKSLVEKITNQKAPKVDAPSGKLDAAELDSWKINAIEQLQVLVDKELGGPIQELSDYLKKELQR